MLIYWNQTLRRESLRRKAAEQRFRNIIERISIAACLIDKNDNIYLHNNRFINLFGYTKEEIPNISEWWPRAYPDESYRNQVIESWTRSVQRAEENSSDIEAKEYSITCKDGQIRDMEISGIVLGDEYLITLIDNTEHNLAREDLKKAKETTEAANERLQELDRLKSMFIASMSHELRTPLNSIISFSGILLQGLQCH